MSVSRGLISLNLHMLMCTNNMSMVLRHATITVKDQCRRWLNTSTGSTIMDGTSTLDFLLFSHSCYHFSGLMLDSLPAIPRTVHQPSMSQSLLMPLRPLVTIMKKIIEFLCDYYLCRVVNALYVFMNSSQPIICISIFHSVIVLVSIPR